MREGGTLLLVYSDGNWQCFVQRAVTHVIVKEPILCDSSTTTAVDEDGLMYDPVKLADLRCSVHRIADPSRHLSVIPFLLVLLPRIFTGDSVQVNHCVGGNWC